MAEIDVFRTRSDEMHKILIFRLKNVISSDYKTLYKTCWINCRDIVENRGENW